MRAAKKKPKTIAPLAPASAADFELINAALEQHLDLSWSGPSEAAIKQELTPANFRRVQEIMAFISNQGAWLNDQSLSSAADKVSGKVAQQYPALSPSAVFKLINQATYGYR